MGCTVHACLGPRMYSQRCVALPPHPHPPHLQAFRSNLGALRDAFPSTEHVEFLHATAVKTNPTAGLMRLGKADGHGAECASIGEVQHALRLASIIAAPTPLPLLNPGNCDIIVLPTQACRGNLPRVPANDDAAAPPHTPLSALRLYTAGVQRKRHHLRFAVQVFERDYVYA